MQRILAERRRRWEEQQWQKEIDRAKQKAAKAARKAAGRPLGRGEKLDPAEWQSLPEGTYAGFLPKDDRWRRKYKESKPPAMDDLTDFATLPDGWVWTTTGQLCDCIVPNRDKPKSFSGEIPWITLPDFEDDKVEIHRSKSGLGLSQREVLSYRAKVIPKGSVVMSCVGRFGISAVLGRDAVINQQLHAFLIAPGLEPRYLAYAVKTQVPFMEEAATATTIAYLNQSKCGSVPIALPPLAEQRRVLDGLESRLSVAGVLHGAIRANLARAGRLRQAILQRAFEGRLVPQDPSDEPASALLARIRAQRAERDTSSAKGRQRQRRLPAT